MSRISIEQKQASLVDGQCLSATVDAQLTAPEALALTINAAFVPKPIPRGIIVLVECQVGTTGARFEVTSEAATLRNETTADTVDTSHTVGSTQSETRKSEPGASLKSGQAELSVKLPSTESSKSHTASTSFAGKECLLAITEIGGGGIRWHLRSHRGTKAVVDYIEGNLSLRASGRWRAPKCPVLKVSAQPTDIRYFGPDGQVLSRRSSMALWLWLRARGEPIPSREATRHTVRVIEGGE